jgi:hypothetical protein
MRVRLTVKLAEIVNGIDLSRWAEGDIIEIDDRDGELLWAEGWAELVADEEPEPRPAGERVPVAGKSPAAVAADQPTRKKRSH